MRSPIPCRGRTTSLRRSSRHRERYAELLTAAGFRVEVDEDRTAAAAGPPAPGALTPAPVFGAGFVERIGNNIAAAMAGLLAPVLIVARAT